MLEKIMPSVALIIGNSEYKNLTDLPCCSEDAAAIELLIDCTKKFDEVYQAINLSAEEMRDFIRKKLPSGQSYEEILFYFSGHGDQSADELYLCGTDYRDTKPNETGLSQKSLHELVRDVSPTLFVKIVDSCHSGASLIKRAFHLKEPKGFEKVIQFSSSLQTQASLAGEPLSEFTSTFIKAAMEKKEGRVYYSDIVNSLRDLYLENDEQTPFFVSQGTGREILLDEAENLAPLRQKFAEVWEPKKVSDTGGEEDGATEQSQVVRLLTPLERLRKLEDNFVKPELAEAFIASIFEGVVQRFEQGKYAEFFDIAVSDSSFYEDEESYDFMARILHREDRRDRFVTAKLKRTKKRENPFDQITNAMNNFYPDWTQSYDLQLNCTLEKAQCVISLTPKVQALQKLKLVLSVAPSLETCYLFELLSRHQLIDWDRFSSDGEEVVRRWYKLDWGQDVDYLNDKIVNSLDGAIDAHIERCLPNDEEE